MKKQLFNKTEIVSGVCGILMLTGCVGMGVDTELKLGGTTVNNFGTGKPGTEIRNAAPKVMESTEEIILIGNQKDLLRMNVNPEGVSNDEKSLASTLAAQISGNIGAEDAIVGKSGANDLVMTVLPKLVLVDQDGDYYRMNCNIAVQIKSPLSGQIFSGKTFKIVSKQRVLGKDAAIAQFEKNSDEICSWCKTELNRIATKEIGVSLITIQLPTMKKGQPRNGVKDAAAIKNIGDNLGKMPNLISYELAGQDSGKGTCTYRIAYFKTAYPAGLANAISALVGSLAYNK